jgi:type II secretory pathway predicted ATPase ExeA
MLKETLAAHSISLTELGQAVIQKTGRFQGRGFGVAAMSRLINHGHWPKAAAQAEIKTQIEDFLKGRGVAPTEIKRLWAADAPAALGTDPITKGEDKMLPPKATLSQYAKRHFKLARDPFGDLEDDAQFYESNSVRMLREYILTAMKTGGFVALVGESGAGKTELLRECQELIVRTGERVRIIRPHITGMDIDSGRGSPLRARTIMNEILDAIAPNAKRYAEPSRLSAEVERQLSARFGDGEGKEKFVLVIGDADRLRPSTLKHLKDLYELRLGRKRLLSIVLEGQLPLAQRLDPFNEEFIQIAQRCELLLLKPIGGEFALSEKEERETVSEDALTRDLREYIACRLNGTGRKPADIFKPDAYLALRKRLSGTRKDRRINLAYPLAVNNCLTRALNLAAESGADFVDADIIQEA